MLLGRRFLLAGWAWLLCVPALGKSLVEIQPGTVRPGEIVLVKVTGASELPTGTFGKRPLLFYPRGKHHEALTGLPVESEPGTVELTVKLGEKAAPLVATLDVVDPRFPARELTVANKFISPPASVKKRMAEDRAAFAKAFEQPFAPRSFGKDFAWPRHALITARFGDRRTFNGKQQSQHYGTDLDGRVGEPIFASNEGTVVLVRDCYSSGNTVIVHHGANLYTAYFHLSRFTVEEGQKVQQGQKLGLVGKTGRVTGPHLHWAVKVDGLYVSGESLLRLSFD